MFLNTFRQAIPQLTQTVIVQTRSDQTVFSIEDRDMKRAFLVEHSIPVEESIRIIWPLCPLPLLPGEALVNNPKKKKTQEHLKKKLIKHSYRAWSSLVVLVKTENGCWKFHIDIRRLNKIRHWYPYPLFHIDSLDALGYNKYFSNLGLVSWF